MDTVSVAGPCGDTPPLRVCPSTLSLRRSWRNRTTFECCRSVFICWPSCRAASGSRATSCNFSHLEESSLSGCLFQGALGHSIHRAGRLRGTDHGPRVGGPGAELPQQIPRGLPRRWEHFLRKDLPRAGVGMLHGIVSASCPPWARDSSGVAATRGRQPSTHFSPFLPKEPWALPAMCGQLKILCSFPASLAVRGEQARNRSRSRSGWVGPLGKWLQSAQTRLGQILTPALPLPPAGAHTGQHPVTVCDKGISGMAEEEGRASRAPSWTSQ